MDTQQDMLPDVYKRQEKKFVLFGESDGAILNEYLSKPQLLSMQGDIDVYKRQALGKTYTVVSKAVKIRCFHVACVVTAHHLCRVIVCHYIDCLLYTSRCV